MLLLLPVCTCIHVHYCVPCFHDFCTTIPTSFNICVFALVYLVLKFKDILCAGGKEGLLSTPADTHSPSHGGGPVEADSETTGRHTGM